VITGGDEGMNGREGEPSLRQSLYRGLKREATGMRGGGDKKEHLGA